MNSPRFLSRLFTTLTVLAFALLATPQIFAAPKEVPVVKTWKGEVKDDALLKDAPAFIASAEGLAKLWKEWKLAGQPPEVDFAKQIVVVMTTKGSLMQPNFRLDEKGNLQSVGIATMDFLPGFRYILATVDRAGIKTVEGKEVPAK
jgi:hypothetical protein